MSAVPPSKTDMNARSAAYNAKREALADSIRSNPDAAADRIMELELELEIAEKCLNYYEWGDTARQQERSGGTL